MTISQHTPKQALNHLRLLEQDGYWEQFSILHFTARHWQPASLKHLRTELHCKHRFHEGSKMEALAIDLALTVESRGRKK